MGQSQSNNNNNNTTNPRVDNASTRTLHSYRNSNRPMSFLRRISHRISTSHPTRRFSQNRNQRTDLSNNPVAQPTPTRQYSSLHHSASSTTSSVRRATQEATRQAAAATGPHILIQQQRDSMPDSASFLNELLNSSDSASRVRHAFSSRRLPIPLRVQQEINSSLLEDTAPPIPSSASSTTTNSNQSRRMHVIVIEYRANTAPQHEPLTPPPTYRFMGLRRPRSQVSTTSSTDTIQSMPLSMHSRPPAPGEGHWVVYVVNNSNAAYHALSSTMEENPSYEELLWLSNMLGNVRPSTTTQAAVDEAIPVIDWSDDTKNQLKR